MNPRGALCLRQHSRRITEFKIINQEMGMALCDRNLKFKI